MSSRVDCDVEMLTAILEQTGQRAVRGVSKVLEEGAYAIRDKAREYAPVDTEGLEEAIDVRRFQRIGGNQRGSSAAMFQVFVDFSKSNANNESIGLYAWYMHELLAPYGSGAYSLGPKSQAKAATGKAVGGKYLERAVIDYEEAITQRVHEIAMRALKK